MSKRRSRSRGGRGTVSYAASAPGAARRRRNVTVAMAGVAVVVVLILSAMAGPSVLFGGGTSPGAAATATIPPLLVFPSGQPFATIVPIAP